MKLNKKKTVFALALSACIAGMTFSASLPFLSASAEEDSLKVTTIACGSEGAYCPNEKQYKLKDCNTSFDTLPKPTCEGWVFAGWYTQPVTYYFWGSQTWSTEKESTHRLTPPEKWKDAIEFQDYKEETPEQGSLDSSYTKDKLKYRNRYWTFLSISTSDSKNCDDNCKDNGTKGELVTKDNFDTLCKKEEECGITLYARFVPQTVKIQWTVDFEGEIVKYENGCWRQYNHGMGSSYRQYGSPVGDLWSQDAIGARAQNRKLTGWHVSTKEELLNEKEVTWSNKTLDSKLGLTHLESEKKNGATRYQWEVEIKASFDNQVIPEVEVKKETLKSSPAQAEEPSAPAEHVHTGHHSFTEATCESTGIDSHFECDCGKWFSDMSCTKEITDKESLTTPIRHNLVKTTGKQATCTENGYAECYYCKTCEKFFSDANGQQPLESPVIPATGHDFGDNHTCACGEHDEGYVPDVQAPVAPVESEAQETHTEPETKTPAPEATQQDEPTSQPEEEVTAPEKAEKKEEAKAEPKQEVEKEAKTEEVKESVKEEPKAQEEVREEPKAEPQAEPETEEPQKEEKPEVEPEQEPEVEVAEPEEEEELPEPEIDENKLPSKTPEVGRAHIDFEDEKPEEPATPAEDEAEEQTQKDANGDVANADIGSATAQADPLPESASSEPATGSSNVAAIAIGTAVGTLTLCGAAATIFIKRRRF